MAKPTITVTKNYRLFHNTIDNRDLYQPKHRRLKASMKKYGFLRSYPIVCVRNGSSGLVVKDGQHRLAFAEELGLSVAYIVETEDFDIAEINSTSVTWSIMDYANKWAKQGREDYQEVIDFSVEHKIPIGMAFGILYGDQDGGNNREQIIGGTFKVRDREYAAKVAQLYSTLVSLSPVLRNRSCLAACTAVTRVDDFDSSRLIQGAKRCRDKLVSFSTRDAYLDLFEELYNFGRKHLSPLKVPALTALKDRAAVKKS